jgi:response regulator of citrate/malate metabolism
MRRRFGRRLRNCIRTWRRRRRKLSEKRQSSQQMIRGGRKTSR